MRIYGGKENLCTKFKSIRWIVFTFSGIFVVLVVLLTEINHLGQQKSQTVDLIEDTPFVYDAKECLTLLFVSYFYASEIFQRV